MIGVKSSSNLTVRESDTKRENHSEKIAENSFRIWTMTDFSVISISVIKFFCIQSCNPLR